ncbi:hypothetical protein [Paenibacillus illinoisensis]|uniref:hypothetical protein n=1 Tax=Paenibacillus illinoisensis TaxID=59845 RepID=UPI001C8DFBA6|nr:hypothetical protein [Paenibacillus illinoisensis]MBY0217908.1 hypothetical protein [Paenibacillus illinoisensis]
MLDKKAKVAEKNSIDEMEIEDAPLFRPNPVFEHSKNARWPRDAKVGARVLHLSKFKCSFDESHVFLLRSNSSSELRLACNHNRMKVMC